MDVDVVIIGGGPAGAQCALWVNNLGYKSVIIEKNSNLGGMQAISPYQNNWLITNQNISGVEIAQIIENNINNSAVIIEKNSNITSISKAKKNIIVTSKYCKYNTKFLVVATGTIPENGGITNNKNILIGPGHQIEQANLYNKSVAILGGGDNAIENYLFIKKKKPKSIQIYARNIRARNNLLQYIEKENLYVGKYDLNQNIIKSKLGTISYDIVIILYGWKGNYPSALDILNISTEKNSFLKVNNFCTTNIDNIYAIGDINNRNHPCVATAISDGTIAAKDICNKLKWY